MSPRSVVSRMAELLGRGSPGAPAFRFVYGIDTQTDRVTRLAWSHDGEFLAVPSRDGGVRVHDARNGALLTELEGHAGPAMGVAFSPDDRRLASIGDRDLRVWNVARGELHESFICREGSPTGVAWSDGFLAVTSEAGFVLRWRDGETTAATDGHPGELPRLVRATALDSPGALHASFSLDGSLLAVGSRDGVVRVWGPRTTSPLAELVGHADASVVTAWSPDGRHIASGAKDGTCRIWSTTRPPDHAVLECRSAEVRAVAWHPGGRLLAAKSRDGVSLWRPDPWRSVALIAERGPSLGFSTGLAFHPRLPLLATLGMEDRQVRVWWMDPADLPHDELPLRDPPAAERPVIPEPRPRRRIVIV